METLPGLPFIPRAAAAKPFIKGEGGETTQEERELAGRTDPDGPELQRGSWTLVTSWELGWRVGPGQLTRLSYAAIKCE